MNIDSSIVLIDCLSDHACFTLVTILKKHYWIFLAYMKISHEIYIWSFLFKILAISRVKKKKLNCLTRSNWVLTACQKHLVLEILHSRLFQGNYGILNIIFIDNHLQSLLEVDILKWFLKICHTAYIIFNNLFRVSKNILAF